MDQRVGWREKGSTILNAQETPPPCQVGLCSCIEADIVMRQPDLTEQAKEFPEEGSSWADNGRGMAQVPQE